MDQPLHDALAELRRRLLRVEVEEADEVHEQEPDEEEQQHGGGARHTPTVVAGAIEAPDGEKQQRRDVGEVHGARDVPVHLLEGRAEHGGEEQRADEAALRAARA